MHLFRVVVAGWYHGVVVAPTKHEAIDLVLKQCLPGVSKETIQNEREVALAEIIDLDSVMKPTIIV